MFIGFIQQPYLKYQNKCLTDRDCQGEGKSTEMRTLFRFWSFFLRSSATFSIITVLQNIKIFFAQTWRIISNEYNL